MLLLCAVQHVMFAGPQDSLWAVWNDASRNDTERLDAIESYARQRFGEADPDSLLICAGRMHDFARSVGNDLYVGKALMLRAQAMMQSGEAQEPVAVLDSAIVIFSKVGNEPLEIRALNVIASAYANQGDYARGIERLTQALRKAEARRDTSMTARILGNIGALYHMQDDLDNAMSYYMRRRVIAEKIGQKDILSEVIGNIGIIHETRKEFDLALSAYEQSLSIAREIGYENMVYNCHNNIGNVYTEQKRYPEARAQFQLVMQVAQEAGDMVGVALAHIGLADIDLRTGAASAALKHAQVAMDLANEADQMSFRRDAAERLYKANKALGQGSMALKMHELFISLRDSIKSEENATAMMTQKFQYDFDKKEALLAAEQEKKDALAAEALRRKNLQRNAFIGGFGLMVLLAGTFFFQRNRISKEKARSEELLLNILPEEVAEELKEKGEAQAVHLDQVTVLFTDFKGFTSLSENLTPRELVRDLNECFSAFDRITEKYGIEKIKTIGDAYMAAGGLPVANTTHAVDTVKAALEIRDFIEEGKQRKIAAGKPYFEVRIGVHSGPVVAGIVGVKKFQYDIWGDTVNTASRMESSGAVGQVNMSGTTYQLVRGTSGLHFTPRGKVIAKGKGEMEMYFVERA
ncbi:MAG: tetratricopeptide repeat protein [Flavobacteriales bacterium]|nr:tetratricopeptide repeat protein [Flavobacteriales bacterium]